MAEAVAETLIRAAGGVVWRAGDSGLEVVLVHRPAYDDWSLPKGKVNPGESDEACAIREVEEETGLRCELRLELPSTRYRDRHDRPKLVRYWAMVPVAGQLAAADEVDEARWMDVATAREILSYDRDKAVLDAFEASIASAES